MRIINDVSPMSSSYYINSSNGSHISLYDLWIPKHQNPNV